MRLCFVMPVEDMPAKLLDYQGHLLKVAAQKDSDGTRLDAGEQDQLDPARPGRARLQQAQGKDHGASHQRRIQMSPSSSASLLSPHSPFQSS
jgi:hypothetical protein